MAVVVVINAQSSLLSAIGDNQHRISQSPVHTVPYPSNQTDDTLDLASKGGRLQNR